MDEWPSSPSSLVVNSPRKTFSLLRERTTTLSLSDPIDKASAGFARDHGPKPSEVYGFVGSITTVIATVIYLVWAYIPEPWLHSLGITYYPSKLVLGIGNSSFLHSNGGSRDGILSGNEFHRHSFTNFI